jgi:Uma2 family endonuclease
MALPADAERDIRRDGRPFTVDDLEVMPDDGHRYELIDGVLVVSPAPSLAHQEAAGTLYLLLRAACPPDLYVVIAPFEWRPSAETGIQPDVLVARRADLLTVDGLKHLVKPPVLAVEAISPSSRRIDRLTKLSVYEDAGVPSYWLVDPDLKEPSVTALELVNGRYREVAKVSGAQSWTAECPFPVTIRPDDLVAALRW